jgi:N-acetylglutamate synthase-like GNAT family acetyltransferase
MNLKSGNIKTFEQYSQFSSLKEFNNHIEMWMVEYKKEFTKAELVGLKRLVRFSAKFPGVCNAKIATVLKAIHEEYHDNGISRSSFKRMIGKAKKLGIFTVYETERKNGSQSSNLYIFNRFSINELPTDEKLNHHKTSNLSKTKNQNINKRKNNEFDDNFLDTTVSHNSKNIATNNGDQQAAGRTITSDNSQSITNYSPDLDYTFANDEVPQIFRQLVKCFFDEAKTIEEYWKMTKIAAYRNNCENKKEQVLGIAIHSFKQMINKLKLTEAIKKPIAYFYGILNKKFEHLYFEELAEMEISDESCDAEVTYSLDLGKALFS